MVKVTILKDGTWRGRQYVRGEVIRIPPVDALVLSRLGLISLAKPGTKTSDLNANNGKPSTSRTYRRRDMTAEP